VKLCWTFFADFVSVVTNGCYVFNTSCCSLVCHVSIADWFVPLIGREYIDTWHIDTWHILIGRSTFTELWSDGPTNMRNLKKNVTNWAGICWHVACWHVADFDRTVHVYRAGTCHVEMINCGKVRLPRQICDFCVSAVSGMESRFLFLESQSAFFFICLSRPKWERRPTRAKDDRRTFFLVPIFCVDLVRNLFWFVDIFREGNHFSFLRKIIIKIIHWIIPPGWGSTEPPNMCWRASPHPCVDCIPSIHL
jgi:hypothetical protein